MQSPHHILFMANHDVIGVGGLAGSFHVLHDALAKLPANLPAALYVTKSQRITTHYSHPELSNLTAAAEKACGYGSYTKLPRPPGYFPATRWGAGGNSVLTL